jgi:acyl-CoA hydrolase
MHNNTVENTVTMTEIVLPNDTNPLGILLGGRLLYWMDIAAAICAQNHAGRVAVTASIDSISFDCPIKIGNVTYIIARPTRVFRTSMEIYVEVFKRETGAKARLKTNEAYFTFVALDEGGKPVPIAPIFPKNGEEKLLFDAALERRDNKKTTAPSTEIKKI